MTKSIRYKILFFTSILLGFYQYPEAQTRKEAHQQEVDCVNPLIGTSFTGIQKGAGGGGTMPCVGTPFAMTNFVAQTCENKMGRMIYRYEDSTIMGFTATHQPTVWMGDYGYVSVMPQIGQLKVLPKERALSYSHQDEIAKPYYYSTLLNTGNGQKIKAEIAASGRCAIFQFTFPKTEEAHLIIQGINLDVANGNKTNDIESRAKRLKGYVKIDNVKDEITGYNPDRMSAQLGPDLPNFKGYFIIQFDKTIESFGTWDKGQITPSSTEQYGTQMGAYINFKVKKNEKVKVRIATSFISIEQARGNMLHEVPDWDFTKLANATKETWQENLSRIKVDGATQEQKTIFYTAMFHSMLFPREFSEYGKYYSAFDDQVHEGVSYNDYSLWDTFRALHPLLILIQPQRVSPMIRSLLQMYKEGGWMPMWPNPTYTNIMIGTHADAVIADAWEKGFRDYDVNLAYEAMRKDAMVPPDGDTQKRWGDRDRWTGFEGRGGLSYYHSLGYVPDDKTSQSVSRTIEFSFDDFCVSQLAKDLGKTEDYKRLKEWSGNYRNVYNKETGFMAPRLYDGSWSKTPNKGFTEGSPWDYLFGAFHDIPGMIHLMGGKEQFAKKLDMTFAGDHYRLDNEPGHHYGYLYDYCNQPWKTQELVRNYTRINYRNQPNGINGNDDCGQMSAWYIFSTLGFYPVTPGLPVYSIGSPTFKNVRIYLANGKVFEIEAKNVSVDNKYIQSATLNGKPLNIPWFNHKDLEEGGTLVFEMGPEANHNWGISGN
ncbi:MAG: GH92 family glycosyl hydrolase [Bacteroidetes bacterium]|nr:GH92 family glycosyl hydrolase [Bacteroidota bacterium]